MLKCMCPHALNHVSICTDKARPVINVIHHCMQAGTYRFPKPEETFKNVLSILRSNKAAVEWLTDKGSNNVDDIPAYRNFVDALEQAIRDVALSAGFVEHGTFLWAKLGKGGNAGEQLARLYEVALIFGRTAAPELTEAGLLPPRHHISGYDDDGEASHWEHHPNHKPFSLLEPLIRAYSQPGDVVLEPFSGSGSTAAAAVRLGRRARAIELRAKWAGVSGQRLQAETVGREPPSPSS